MMLVKSPVQCLAQKKWDCLTAGSTRGSPQCPAFRVPVHSRPPTRLLPPLPPHSGLLRPPGRERGWGVPVGRIYRSQLAMGGAPAVDAGAEKREGELTVPCGGGYAGRELDHCNWGGGYAAGEPGGTAQGWRAGLGSRVFGQAFSPAEPQRQPVGGARGKEGGAEPEETKGSSASPCPNMVPNLRPGCTIA